MRAVTFPRGFRASGIACGLKESGKPDLALIVSDVPASAAGMFTQNRVVAAPVTLSRNVVTGGSARATVVNSGNANACTGAQGDADAREMASLTAAALGCDPAHVLVASTGIIGRPMAMGRLRAGIPLAAAALSATAARTPRTRSARPTPTRRPARRPPCSPAARCGSVPWRRGPA